MTWSKGQPICDSCWRARNPGRTPIRVREPKQEHCCYCNTLNTSGILVRVDPDAVPHPTRRENP